MAAYTVLIVDDQRDVRRMLRAGLESLAHDISVVDVPSGEEAILVISQQIIDLLIADELLPGISGLELKERAQIRNPDLKFFLITGIQDQKTRKEVMNAGADAYFFKPIEMTDFLKAVRKCLKLDAGVREEAARKIMVEDTQHPSPGITQILSRLRQDLDAVCALLISENGQLMVQAGTLPEESSDPNLMAAMMATFSTATNVSLMLGLEIPRNMFYFSGKYHEFFLSHVGQSMGLLVILNAPTWTAEKSWKTINSIGSAVQDFTKMLSEHGAPLVIQVVEPSFPSIAKSEDEPDGEMPQADIDLVLNRVKIKPKEADKFWETASEESIDEVERKDTMSYEQARQRGITPLEEEN